ncbi:hypothetical protein Pint_05414 [Pistacia integerrima]|uniref:Uncharacterized protein n=1 Tax=Pistacia integerrima TaxID=434235 RepID=A0ACC0Z8K7_9ROSI|nr:hypothetical protein Pint_05414 [Pistacia integerrima]
MPTNLHADQNNSKGKLVQDNSAQAKITIIASQDNSAQVKRVIQDEQDHWAQVKMAMQDEPTWLKASQAQFINSNTIFGYNLISWEPMSQNGRESSNMGKVQGHEIKKSRRQATTMQTQDFPFRERTLHDIPVAVCPLSTFGKSKKSSFHLCLV